MPCDIAVVVEDQNRKEKANRYEIFRTKGKCKQEVAVQGHACRSSQNQDNSDGLHDSETPAPMGLPKSPKTKRSKKEIRTQSHRTNSFTDKRSRGVLRKVLEILVITSFEAPVDGQQRQA